MLLQLFICQIDTELLKAAINKLMREVNEIQDNKHQKL